MEEDAYNLPEDTKEQIIDKISSLAWEIRSDWNDPRNQCRKIVELCNKLKTING